jgi:hypothetical protein
MTTNARSAREGVPPLKGLAKLTDRPAAITAAVAERSPRTSEPAGLSATPFRAPHVLQAAAASPVEKSPQPLRGDATPAPVLPAEQPSPVPPQVPFDPAFFEKIVQRRLLFLRTEREAKRRLDEEERPPFSLPPVLTLRDHLAQSQPTTCWRIEGWLPIDARVTLVAQFKAGKTTAVSNLARSLVDGHPWLGAATVTPIEGSVAIIDGEMSERQLIAWYRDQGISNTDRIIPVSLRGQVSGFNILDPAVRTRWATYLRTLRAQYVILDCLRPFLDALNLDEQHDGGRFLVAFDALLKEASIREALVVLHMGHGGERARGDSRFRDWPDVEWRLFREHDDPGSARFISAYGRDVNIEECALGYNDAFRHLTLTGGGSRRDADAHRALIAVREAVAAATKPLSGRDVEEAVKGEHGQKAIRAALRLGVKAGAILVDRNGPRGAHLYQLPPGDSAVLTAEPASPSALARGSAS